MKKVSLQTLAIEFAATKSEKIFTEIYAKLKPNLTYHVNNMVKDSAATDDIISNAFSNIWTRIDQYNTFWNFSTWAYKIATNEAIVYMRRKKKEVSISSYGNYDGDEGSNVEGALLKNAIFSDDIKVDADWEFDREIEVEERLYTMIIEEMQNIPDTYKEVIIDRELNKLKYTDIQEKYNYKNLDTVKTVIRRARALVNERIIKRQDTTELVKPYTPVVKLDENGKKKKVKAKLEFKDHKEFSDLFPY
jgi:RNA polymerase sigma factor (sigma-70 family)